MRFSPKLQFMIAHGLITIPLSIPVLVVICIALANPFWFREAMLHRTMKGIAALANWRDSLPMIKYYRDKMNLFDMLRG